MILSEKPLEVLRDLRRHPGWVIYLEHLAAVYDGVRDDLETERQDVAFVQGRAAAIGELLKGQRGSLDNLIYTLEQTKK